MPGKGQSAVPIALLIILASVLSLVPSWINYDIIANDGAFQYIPVAELFLQGRFKDAFLTPQLPLFPLLIAGVSALSGADPELSGRLIASAAYVIAALGLYRLSMLLFRQPWVALLSVLFMITNIELVDTSVDCLKESLLVALIVWSNVWMLRWVEDRRPWSLLVGVLLLLLGGLLRSAALFFVGAWLLLWAFRERRGLALRLAILIAPVILVVAVWRIAPDLPIFVRSYNLRLIFKPEHTPLFLLRAVGRVLNELLAVGNPILVLFACWGLYRQRAHLYARYLLGVLALYLLILTMWGFVSGRYLLAPIVCLYPLAAYSVHAAWQSGRNVWKACAVMAVVSCVALWGYQAQIPPDPDKLARKEAGQWILAQIGPGREIMSNRKRLVFYARGVAVPLKNIKASEPLPCIAVDIDTEEGRKFKVRSDKAGLQSDKVFRTIHVYLPKS